MFSRQNYTCRDIHALVFVLFSFCRDKNLMVLVAAAANDTPRLLMVFGSHVQARNEGLMPGYFAFTLLMALHVFVEQKVDAVLLEVGVGGEYDATNSIRRPVACGIASLHLEHTEQLGHTLEEIGWHKAGIAKVGRSLSSSSLNNNNNNEYLERPTRTGPKRLHVLYKYIFVKIQCIQHECTHTRTHTHRLAHARTHTCTNTHTHTCTHTHTSVAHQGYLLILFIHSVTRCHFKPPQTCFLSR